MEIIATFMNSERLSIIIFKKCLVVIKVNLDSIKMTKISR